MKFRLRIARYIYCTTYFTKEFQRLLKKLYMTVTYKQQKAGIIYDKSKQIFFELLSCGPFSIPKVSLLNCGRLLQQFLFRELSFLLVESIATVSRTEKPTIFTTGGELDTGPLLRSDWYMAWGWVDVIFYFRTYVQV